MSVRISVVIPFRDRGIDPRRGANLEVVTAWWHAHGFDPIIQSDGGQGDQQFNRHRAYNRAVSGNPHTNVFVFTEADMLIPPAQILTAIRLAVRKHVLVVPFTQYRYLSDGKTEILRDLYYDQTPEFLADWWAQPVDGDRSIFMTEPEATMDDGKSIGAVNVVSRETLQLTGGFTEATEGNWYDDRIIEEGFAYMTGNRTAFVPGPAVHLYHLPGHAGDHLSDADKRATQRNRDLLVRMRADIRMRNREAVYRLLSYREGAQRHG